MFAGSAEIEKAAEVLRAGGLVAVPESAAVYARELYGFLRELDQRGCDLIIASLPEEKGMGLAIANRLRRAAGPRDV